MPERSSVAMGNRADILVVDDNPANIELLVTLLDDRGYCCRIANNGSRALAAASAVRPDLIMLDIAMPIMDGYEVCRILKADPMTSSVPVIFLSARHDAIDRVQAFAVGAADYVSKPFHLAEVLARVENQVKIARLQREAEAKNLLLTRLNRELHDATAQLEDANKTLTLRLRLSFLQARNAVLEERARIAQEVHDGVAQTLGGALIHLQVAEGAADPHYHVQLAVRLTEQGLNELRRSVATLRPDATDPESNLTHALRDLAAESVSPPTVHVEVEGDSELVPPALGHHLLRIAQETLANACRHAHARSVTIRLVCSEAEISLSVIDDGIGFEVPTRPNRTDGTGFGLQSLRRRARSVGGRLYITSNLGSGTQVSVRVPIRRDVWTRLGLQWNK